MKRGDRVTAVYIFISVLGSYDWNVYRSLQTPSLGESYEKELSDERARDTKRTLSRLSVVSLRNLLGSAKSAG